MVMSSAVMSEAARARLAAVWRRIEDAHYSYLDTDDSPDKLARKKKLDGYITEYLSLVPPSCKFVLPETSEVFLRTVRESPEFSAYRAGRGWAALASYAANLLTQPWRNEYKVIRLYSGFYKHEIEANMVGAERMLGAMGYRGGSGGAGDRLTLEGPPCPDTVAAVSRDALLASVECQIMCEMYEASWNNGVRTSWLQIWNQRQNSNDVTLDQDIYSNVPATNALPTEIQRNRYIDTRYPQPMPQYHEELPIEEPITPMIHPQYMIPPMMYPIPQEVPVTVPMMTPYGVPCYYPAQYMIPTPVYAPIKQATTVPINGYPPIQHCRLPAVPTAQLIELDAPLIYENGKHERHREDERNHRRSKNDSRLNSSRSNFSDVTLPSLPRSDTQPALSKAKEDGMGTYESWDYVFRNLSSKDQDDRSRFSPSLDRDSRTLDRLERDEKRSKFHPTTLDLEDGLQALHLDRSHDDDMYRTAKVNENLMKLKQEQELKRARLLKKQEEKRTKRVIEPVENPSSDGLIPSKVAPDKVKLLTKRDIKDRKEVLKQQNSVNGDVPRKPKKPSKLIVDERQRSKPMENGTAHGSKSSSASTSQTNYDLKSQLVVSLDEPDFVRRSPPKTNGDVTQSRLQDVTSQNGAKWECGTCTYLNKGAMQVCEMCGKSRKGPEIRPLTSGGKECPACTLVNQRDSRICDACGTSLEHCPTYI